MARKNRVWDKLAAARVQARWREVAQDAARLDMTSVRARRDQAQRLRPHIDLFLHRAEERLGLPTRADRNFPRPDTADWAWRPELWRAAWPGCDRAPLGSGTRIGTEATFFHDARLAEVALRQRPNLRERDLAPYRVELDVLGFDGSFLSMVLDLPKEAVTDLRRDHILQVNLTVELEAPIDVFVRLNVQHGPNTEQMTLSAPHGAREAVVEFDLAYSALNEKRVEKAWVDIIFEHPQMNQAVLRDVTFSRRLRAAL